MDINDQKATFSEAYARAIASIAGLVCSKPELDRDSVDIRFESQTSPFIAISAQLKSTSRTDVIVGNEIHFPLPVKNYNDLRATTIMPRILIILVLPEKPIDQDEQPQLWVNQTPESLALLKCAYWTSLVNSPQTNNQSTVTITIPMDDAHMFKPSVLTSLVDKVASMRTGA